MPRRETNSDDEISDDADEELVAAALTFNFDSAVKLDVDDVSID